MCSAFCCASLHWDLGPEVPRLSILSELAPTRYELQTCTLSIQSKATPLPPFTLPIPQCCVLACLSNHTYIPWSFINIILNLLLSTTYVRTFYAISIMSKATLAAQSPLIISSTSLHLFPRSLLCHHSLIMTYNLVVWRISGTTITFGFMKRVLEVDRSSIETRAPR